MIYFIKIWLKRKKIFFKLIRSYLGQKNLHFQIGKPSSQAHSRSIAIRQRSKWMNIFTGAALAGLQPSFGSEWVCILAIFLHCASHNGGKYHLYSLWYGVSTNNCVFLEGTAITNNRTINSINNKANDRSIRILRLFIFLYSYYVHHTEILLLWTLSNNGIGQVFGKRAVHSDQVWLFSIHWRFFLAPLVVLPTGTLLSKQPWRSVIN